MFYISSFPKKHRDKQLFNLATLNPGLTPDVITDNWLYYSSSIISVVVALTLWVVKQEYSGRYIFYYGCSSFAVWKALIV